MTRMTTPDVMGDVLAPAAARRMAGSLLRMDGGTQPRDQISDELVMEYRDAMAEGALFPPVVAFFDGSDYWLADGFHRVHAADAAGIEVLVDVRQGTRRDAVLFSAGANATHGQRRTNADKRRAVLALLHDDEWRQWSDREIARRCAVSNQFVSNVRSGLSVNDGQMETRRVVRQGTEYDMAVPQRTAAPALASQGVKWASQVDLQLAIGDWLDAFDDPGAVLDELARDGQGSVLWEDVAGSMPVHREADLVVAIAAFRERMAATRKQIDKPAATPADDGSGCAMRMKVERSGFQRGTPTIKFTGTMDGNGGIVTATVTEDQVRLYASSAVLTVAEWRKLRDGIDLAFDEIGR